MQPATYENHLTVSPPPPAAPEPEAQRKQEDIELVARCAAKEDEALGELFDRYGGLLQGLALRMLRDRRDAEDVVQEALFYAWKRSGSYDSRRSSVSTWLVLITRSRALDRIRHRTTVHKTQIPMGWDLPDARVEAEGFGAAWLRQRSTRVREALQILPPEQREVLELQFFQGLTQKEGSELLSIPLGTFKTRVLLAVRKLRRELADEIRDLT